MNGIKLMPIGDLYELEEDAEIIYRGQTVKAAKGMQYDGASVPRAFWAAIGDPFNPKFMRAALFHDRLYTTHEQDKDYADCMLTSLLIEDGIKPVIALQIYEAVHLFGGSHWDAK